MTIKNLSEESCWSKCYEEGGGENGGCSCPEQIVVDRDLENEPVERFLTLDEYCETCRAEYN